MIKKGFYNGMSMLAAWLIFSGLCMGADFKSAELQRKAEEIAALRIKLSEKVDRAENMRQEMADLMEGYAAEIRREKNRWRFSSYRNAVGNLRIAYDLELLQQLQAYISELDKRIAYFRQAGQVLEYYFRQINDDLLMIRTLDDFTVDQLISKINNALDEYVPATIRKTVQIDHLRLKDTELIWQEVVMADKG
jgi:hypothetical protein